MSDILKNIWPDWTITEKLGSGAFGTVYSAKKEDGGHIYESAIKVIHIPQDDAEVRDLRHSGMDYQSICGFYRNVKEGLRNEISVMETLRTAANIVSIDDYKEVQADDGIGWTMYIRMEKLTSLNVYMDSHRMTLDDIVKLGQDMCSALVCCEKENIIHRDIKPDNVFVNKYGDFKLGDFGIARQMEKTQSVRSQKGTYQYMAPEVYRGESYNRTVDIYSLGIMLYRMLNDGRFPFAPAAPQPLLPDDNERALSERMQGKELPFPSSLNIYGKACAGLCSVDKELLSAMDSIILKACSYRAADRYQDAAGMAADLRMWSIRKDVGKSLPQEKRQNSGTNAQIPRNDGTADERHAYNSGNRIHPKNTETVPEPIQMQFPAPHVPMRQGQDVQTHESDSMMQQSVRKKRPIILTMTLVAAAGVSILCVFILCSRINMFLKDHGIITEDTTSAINVRSNDSEFTSDSRSTTSDESGHSSDVENDNTLFNIENGKLTEYFGKDNTVIIPDNVTSIGDSAFSGCWRLTSITIPEGVTSIGNSAFSECSSLTSITIPESVTNIGDYAFYGCNSLTNVTIPESVTSIGDYAFYGCNSLTSITIPDSATNIGDYAFYRCNSLTSITIPDRVTSIGTWAFSGCSSLTSITIPESVTSIGDRAFSHCGSLTSISIPDSVTSIGNETFSGCGSLTIVSSTGSYAESYAAENSIPFQASS